MKYFMSRFNIDFHEQFFINVINYDYSFSGMIYRSSDTDPYVYYKKFIIDDEYNIYSSNLYFQKNEYGYSPWTILDEAQKRDFLKTGFITNILKTKDLPFIRFGCLEKDGMICTGFFSDKNPKISKTKKYFPITYIKRDIQRYMDKDWEIKTYYFIDTDSINKNLRGWKKYKSSYIPQHIYKQKSKKDKIFNILKVNPNESFFIKFNSSVSRMFSYITWNTKYKIDENLNLYVSELNNYGNDTDIYGYKPWIKIRKEEAIGLEKNFYYDFSKIEKMISDGRISIITTKNLPPIKFGILLKDGQYFRGFFKNGKMKKVKKYNKKDNYIYYPINYLKEKILPLLPDGWYIEECFEIDRQSIMDTNNNKRFKRI